MAGKDGNQGTHGLLAGAADWLDSWWPIKLLRVLEVFAILIAIVAFWLELDQRRTDRAVRHAALFAQIAQVQGLPDDDRRWALKASVKALVDEGIAMPGINLSGVGLTAAKLAGADFRRANFRGATLTAAELRNANLEGARLAYTVLEGANLVGADLSEVEIKETQFMEANLTAARLRRVDLSEGDFTAATLNFADLSGSIVGSALTQSQLTAACADPDSPPTGLPEHLQWRGSPCPQPTTFDFELLPRTP